MTGSDDQCSTTIEARKDLQNTAHDFFFNKLIRYVEEFIEIRTHALRFSLK
jgi:DNA topoisomerase IB